jgi:hypothetical protein
MNDYCLLKKNFSMKSKMVVTLIQLHNSPSGFNINDMRLIHENLALLVTSRGACTIFINICEMV